MAVRLLDSYPRANSGRRFGRGVLTLLGLLLTVAGVLAAALPLLFVVGTAYSLVTQGETGLEGMEAEGCGWLVGLTLGAVVGLTLGPRLIRGRRRLVLFLRRFGFVDSSRTLSYAVGTALGRRWRVVTLDDARLVPVGVGDGVRRSFRWGRWIGLALVVVAVLSGFAWFQGETPGRIFKEAFQQGVEQQGGDLQGFLGGLVGAGCITFMVMLIVVVFVAILAAVLTSATLFTWGSYRAVRKAEAAKAMVIEERSQIAPVAHRVERFGRRLFASRLVVVRVASAIWQPVVRALAGVASATLVDVSEPTENLLWEIEELQQAGAALVLVGRRDRLAALVAGGAAGHGLGARLARLIDGEEVLVYEGAKRADLRRFARSLGARLDRA